MTAGRDAIVLTAVRLPALARTIAACDPSLRTMA